MTKSDEIRELFKQGLSRSEIAKRLGIRYQHANNVLQRSGLLVATALSAPIPSVPKPPVVPRPKMLASSLQLQGFVRLGLWQPEGIDGIRLDGAVPSKPGVYAFAVNDEVVYVGVSERNLRRRLYFYSKPGPRQKTSIRIKKLIREELAQGRSVSAYIVHPEGSEWNGINLPMDTAVEAGLIRAIQPIWNKMGL
jgi:hypothetical protein